MDAKALGRGERCWEGIAMRNRMMRTWLKAVLALCAFGGGPVWADETPPTVRFSGLPPRWSNNPNPVFQLEANEPITRYVCTLDGAEYAACSHEPTVELHDLSEGPHVLEVVAYDESGWASATLSYRWTVDVTPPEAPYVVRPSWGALSNSRTPPIDALTEPECLAMIFINGTQVGTVKVNVSGNWGFSWSGHSGLSSGSHELTIVAQDRAGNVSQPSRPTPFEVDVDAPDTFITKGPESVAHDAFPRFEFSATEEPVRYECKINEEPSFSACDALVAGSREFEPGTYTLQVRASDRVSNKDDTPATWTWTYRLEQGGGDDTGCSASGVTPLLPLVALLACLKRRRRPRWSSSSCGASPMSSAPSPT